VPSPQLGWEVVEASVENHWPDLPGNLPGFHVWLPPSEIKETSVNICIISLLISENTSSPYIIYTFHSILSY
jgi:hypothetical protein